MDLTQTSTDELLLAWVEAGREVNETQKAVNDTLRQVLDLLQDATTDMALLNIHVLMDEAEKRKELCVVARYKAGIIQGEVQKRIEQTGGA